MTLANFAHSYESTTTEVAVTSSEVIGIYRGIQIKLPKTSEVAPVQLEAIGMYRGVPINFSKAQTASCSSAAMTYRGIQYGC